MSRLDSLRSTVERIERKGEFTDDPRERLKGLLLSLASDPTLPNATAAGVIVTAIGAMYGYVPLLGFLTNLSAWVVTLIVYAVGDEVRVALEAISEEKSQTDDSNNPGIQ